MSKTKKLAKKVTAKAAEAAQIAVEKAIIDAHRQYITTMPDRTKNLFKTNLLSLDYILGGGIPRGQVVHMYGGEGAGKSTLALQLIAAMQAQGGRAVLFDIENSAQSTHAEALGVDLRPEKFIYLNRTESAEQAFNIAESYVRGTKMDLIVFDSVAAMLPQTVREASNEDDHVATLARLLSMKALPKLNNAIIEKDVILLFVNQMRANIGRGPNVNPWTTPGGNALKFFPNINLRLQYVGKLKEGETVVGQDVKITVAKNKIAAPWREITMKLIYGTGFRRDWDIVSAAVEAGVIGKSGAWFSYKGENIAQGLSAAVDYFAKRPELLDALGTQLFSAVPKAAPVVDADGVIQEEVAPEEATPAPAPPQES